MQYYHYKSKKKEEEKEGEKKEKKRNMLKSRNSEVNIHWTSSQRPFTEIVVTILWLVS